MSNAARGPHVAIAREMSAYANVAGSPMAFRDHDRLGAELVPRPHVPIVATCSGEAREQPHPERAVPFGKCGERLVEQRDDLRVGSGAHPHEAPAVAERGRASRSTSPDLPRQVGGFDERRLGDLGLAGTALRVSESQEQLHPFHAVRRAGKGAERHVVEARALLVGELLHGALGGEPRVRHRSVDGPDGETRVAMARELGEARSEVASAEHLERATRLRRGGGVAATTGSRGGAPRTSRHARSEGDPLGPGCRR